jgi:hypothetical protein
MTNEIFLGILALSLGLVLAWGFRVLPGEGWQIVASVPLKKISKAQWAGVNLTYYGFFVATAQAVAVSTVFLLAASTGILLTSTLAMILLLMAVSLPAAKALARLVEKRKHTFTVGGASFVGTLLLPFIVMGVNRLLFALGRDTIPVMPFLAATVTGYAFGEAVGRLACISFGCCYGRPLFQLGHSATRVFNNFCFVFRGKTKKIAYESGLDGVKVIPVQALTSILYVIAGLAATYLFLEGAFRGSYLLALTVTQLWRFFSEFLRADHRGNGKISTYQVMALCMVFYAVITVYVLPGAEVQKVDIVSGFSALWSPLYIVTVQVLWMVVFFCFGVSKVTDAVLSFKLTET